MIESRKDTFLEKAMASEDTNNLRCALEKAFTQAQVDYAFKRYCIGTWKDGATVFPQIAINGVVGTGKVIICNPEDGNLVKGKVSWIHVITETPKPSQQHLFGEHLLVGNTKKTVLVESERDAVIASIVWPGCIVVACGGMHMLKPELCKVLRGRDVALVPSRGRYTLWKKKGIAMRSMFRSLRITDLIERCQEGCISIGDLILKRYSNIKDIDFDWEIL